jgi:3D (Asp-Asp-Asp) domain-containing protein
MLIELMLCLSLITPIDAKITSYAPLDNVSGICADSNPSVTATGTRPQYGTIAVNPDKVAYGTLLYVEGYGFGIASDTGGALRRYEGVQIDLFQESYSDAINWGVRYQTVYIVEGVLK